MKNPDLKWTALRAVALVLMCFTCMFVDIGTVHAQNTLTVTGTVTDKANGDPLIGASVVEKGTSNGVITNIDGNYSFNVKPGTTIVISSVGYKTVEIKADATKAIVQMEEDSEVLDEVVIVGYGVQKKVNLTGSVASVEADKLEDRPVSSLSQALGGLAAGVQIRQSSGQPGSDGASISIRGRGTFGGGSTAPLIVIDGIVTDEDNAINSVNPEDVESISVLKDAASAAIYGSRAANGVVLITTKGGKFGAKPRVTYSALFAQAYISSKFKIESNTAEWMEMHNRAVINGDPEGVAADPTKLRFYLQDIEAWREAGKNPNSTDNKWGIPNWLAFPNTDWTKHFYKTRFYTKHTVQAQGGGEASTYLLSASYQGNPGTMPNTSLDEYSFRANVETKIAGILRIGTKSFVNHRYGDVGNVATDGGLLYIGQMVPAMTPEYNGKYGALESSTVEGMEINTTMTSQNMENSLGRIVSAGGQNITTRINSTWYAGLDISDYLKLDVKYNYQDAMWDRKSHSVNVKRYSFRTGEVRSEYNGDLSKATTSRSFSRQVAKNFVATANFFKTFGDHDVTALAGYEATYWNYNAFSASKIGLLDYAITDINTGIDMNSIGSPYDYERDYAMQSLFGRVTYAYKSKYLVEANVRYDGSSRFASGHKYGLFPSVSLGYRISEEKFFEPLKSVVENLKLRGSWGKLGNVTSGFYDWQALYGSANLSLNESVSKGLYQSQLPNLALTWETVTTGNIGLDAQFLNRRLNVEFDVYQRQTKGVLVPSIYNYSSRGDVGIPKENGADVRNRGLELTVTWNDKIGNVEYSVGANFSKNSNMVTKYKGKLKYGYDENDLDVNGNPVYKYLNLSDVRVTDDWGSALEGHMLNEEFLQTVYHGSGSYYNGDGTVNPNGGPKSGMIRTSADLKWVQDMVAAGYKFNNQTTAAVSRTAIWYGETIYADNNGDGNYGNEYDRKWTGKSNIPKYNFGITLSAKWKGFDISMLWSGQGGMHYQMYGNGYNYPVYQNPSNVMQVNARNDFFWFDEVAYSAPEDDPNSNYATAKWAQLTTNNRTYQANTGMLYNATYLKLKNLQVGYSFPKQWVQKFKCNNLRVFFSGENLLTITSFPGQDPEYGGIGYGSYPIARLFSAGFNISF